MKKDLVEILTWAGVQVKIGLDGASEISPHAGGEASTSGSDCCEQG